MGDGRVMRGAEPPGDQTSPTIRASPLLLAGPPPRTAEAGAPVWGDPCALQVFSSTPGLCSLDARSTRAPVVTIRCPQTWPMSPRGQSCSAEPLCSGEALLVFLIHSTPPGQASPGPAPGTPIHGPGTPLCGPPTGHRDHLSAVTLPSTVMHRGLGPGWFWGTKVSDGQSLASGAEPPPTWPTWPGAP